MSIKSDATLAQIDAEIEAVNAEYRQRLRHLRAFRKIRADEIITGQKLLPGVEPEKDEK